ncbi:hypothetical protein L218DRAFT_968505 [Marasmius fiardii PR-910]|nr:hypothetical protein L218DRAFT_968505 [Marasmius fiardii PR-910]
MAKLVTSRNMQITLNNLTHLPELVSHPENTTCELNDLHRIQSVFDELNAEAMSSDYTDLEDPQHPLHMYISHYRPIIAKEMEGRKWKRGATYRLCNLDRVLVSKHTTACEMPQCCYNKEFLSTLTSHDFVRLRLMEKKLEGFEWYAEAQEVI